jgi:hypothetical protein
MMKTPLSIPYALYIADVTLRREHANTQKRRREETR